MVHPIFEILAVLVSALSGMITSAEKKMDLVGTYCMALLVAFGGGTLRDMLLVRRPFFWVENSEYLFVILLMSLAFVYVEYFHRLSRQLHSRSNTVDAISLGTFSIVGLFYALDSGMPFFPATLLGVITGVAGGISRDMVTNEIPVIFRHTGGLYAAASFIGCWISLLIIYFLQSPFLGFFVGAVTIVLLRMGSLYYGFTLPAPLWMKDDDLNKKAE